MIGYLLNRYYALGGFVSAMAIPAWSETVVNATEPLVATKAGTPAPVLPTTPGMGQFVISGLLGSLILVSLCIVVLMWLLRKSRLVAGPKQAGVAVVGQIPLSMKEKLLVVQIGDEKLLLGCTSTSINTLHTWSSPGSEDGDASLPQNSPFAKLLARLPSQKGQKISGGDGGGQL